MTLWTATWGSWLNAAAVVAAGGVLEKRFGHHLNPKLQDHWRRWLGLVTVLLSLCLASPLLTLQLGPLPALLSALLLLNLNLPAVPLGINSASAAPFRSVLPAPGKVCCPEPSISLSALAP